MAKQLDAMSSVKLGGFRSLHKASSHTEELLYNETVFLWMTIYILLLLLLLKTIKISKMLLNITMFWLSYHIYQPLRSGRIWHKVNF